MIGKATFVSRATSGTGADQRHYKLDPPLSGMEYVCVSAVDVPFSTCETLIFPSDGEDVIDFMDLAGITGVKDHAAALRGAGYEIVEGDAA